LHSVTAHLKALEAAAATECTVAVPGHGPVLEDLSSLIDLNAKLVHRVIDEILDLAKEPTSASNILTAVLKHFEAPVSDASSFYLLHPTIYAFISHLERAGAIEHEIKDSQSIWRAV